MPSWLGALAGGLGGAVQGARAAYPGVMEMSERRKDREQAEGYRQAYLALQGRQQTLAEDKWTAEQDAVTFERNNPLTGPYGMRRPDNSVGRADITRFAGEVATAGRQAQTPSGFQHVEVGDQAYTFDPNKGTYTPGPKATTGTGSGGSTDVRDLPAAAQSVLAGAESTRASLQRYRDIVNPYMQRSRGDRALGIVGFPNAARDATVGQVESALRGLQLNAKELAALGVLNGPDMDILTEMIGDPTSAASVIRDPAYTLSKIDSAEEFINGRVAAYQQLYGMQPPPGQNNRLRGITGYAHQGAAPIHPENPYR